MLAISHVPSLRPRIIIMMQLLNFQENTADYVLTAISAHKTFTIGRVRSSSLHQKSQSQRNP